MSLLREQAQHPTDIFLDFVASYSKDFGVGLVDLVGWFIGFLRESHCVAQAHLELAV